MPLFEQFAALGWVLAGLVAMLMVACAALWARAADLKREAAHAWSRAQDRGERLAQANRLYMMAEEIAAVGVWQYFPLEDRQDWSKGLREIFGVGPDEELLPGDGETLLATNGIDLVSMVMARRNESTRFSLRFVIMRLDGSMRTIAMRVCHIHDEFGQSCQVIGVVMDITDQTRRVSELVESRDTALREAHMARELALTDPLTGLSNRRRVMAELDRRVLDCMQNSVPLAILVIDIDHFKQINDRFGHLIGDEVLCEVATCLRNQSRREDVVGRIGGEEFVWIACGADGTVARILAERLRQSIAAMSASSDLPATTVSVGFASLRSEDSGLSLFARADQALFEAKDNGRNMVRMAA